MYYSAGTYESFAHPEKPKDVDKKSAYIIGTGLAGLTAAFYLVRDGQMKGEHIHVFEKLDLAGGSCDGRKDITKGFFMRGGREMDNHFEVMWDTFRDVPSIETPGISVLDEYYWLNKHDPNYSLCRASVNRGEDAHTDKQFKLDKDSAMALSKLFMTPEKDLEDKKISDVLPDSFWNTNFWLYWQTMFAFQKWSSALEMKRYLCRYVHHIDGLPDFSALRFTKYNQYESMILPMIKYLEGFGVQFHYNTKVENVEFDIQEYKKVAKRIATEGEMKKYRKVFKLKYDQNGYLVAYQRNSRYIKEEIRNLGFFFIITSEEMSTSKALDIYRGRDNIEKMFRSLKSGIDFNKARVHTTESLKSKVFVTFIAMIVRNELFQKAEELRKKNRKAYTVPGMISELENIECTRNSVGKYRRKYALTAKQKLILKQFDMDEKYIDRSIGEFSY